MCYRPVTNKRDFVRRFMRGEFGNKGPNWDTLEEWQASGYKGLVHIRNRRSAGAGPYNVPPSEVPARYRQLGATPQTFYLAGMAPTERTLFQGEVQQSTDYLHLYYSTIAKPMRDSLREGGTSAKGIIASCLLKRWLDPIGYDWLMVLLERYPEHVVEFSVYSVQWGTLPGYRTVFWEVRRY